MRVDSANVLFVDEVRVNLRVSNGCVRIYCSRGEGNSQKCLLLHDLFGGGSFMV